MEITELRVNLVEGGAERLLAFCSVTFDASFVVRDLKVIEGSSGPFVAMPSRKLTDHCPKCRTKNCLRARYCSECGVRLRENRAPRDEKGRVRLHADVAHPIHTPCREMIQTAVVKAYWEEVERAKEPGYEPERSEREGEAVSEYDDLIAELRASSAERTRGNSQGSAAIGEGAPRSEPPFDRSDETPRSDHDASLQEPFGAVEGGPVPDRTPRLNAIAPSKRTQDEGFAAGIL